MTVNDKIDCCNQCKQPLTEIENRGQRLTGCLNVQPVGDRGRKALEALCEEDLRALHLLPDMADENDQDRLPILNPG
jgi:hypothetical protein